MTVRPGDRIELIYTNDPFTSLSPGTQGTVLFIDDIGTIHVRWDNGSRLGLIPGEDEYRLL